MHEKFTSRYQKSIFIVISNYYHRRPTKTRLFGGGNNLEPNL